MSADIELALLESILLDEYVGAVTFSSEVRFMVPSKPQYCLKVGNGHVFQLRIVK